MRAESPLVRVRLPHGGTAWVVTRHAEAQRLLTDPRVSSDASKPGFPTVRMPEERPDGASADAGEGADGEGTGGGEPLSAEQLNELAEIAQFHEGQFINLDPPRHGHFRRMLISEFGTRRMNELRPEIQRVTDRLIDDMLARDSRADLVEDLGLPLSSLVICRLLGVPYEDHDYFQSATRTMVQLDADPEQVRAAMEGLVEYLDELVKAAAREPGDNLIGRLLVEQVGTGELTRAGLVGMAFLLLTAGHEATANMLPLSVLTLLEHPEQLAELREDPALLPGAVEELLRFHSVSDWAAFDRVAVGDIEIDGRKITAGEGIFVLSASANRDERAFEHPDTFDIHRRARHHIAFGYGAHQCIGQNLARAELEVGLGTLLRRMPSLELDKAVDALPFKYQNLVFGLHAMPVRW
ncbi:cytochrome P450 [Streptomyces albiaxialis]|uniref:Cytochrome P450 n=1 Tax=Streptomyces albiaxialis TaxID=329523 RepID=A0ABP5IMD0_9ACTN